MWQAFFEERHKWIHDVYMSGNIEGAQFILRNPGKSDLFWGIDGLAASELSKVSTYSQNDVYCEYLSR